MNRTKILGVAMVVLFGAACGSGATAPDPAGPALPPPGAPPPRSDRWVQVTGLTPREVPFAFSVMVDITGAGFDGVTQVWFEDAGGERYPATISYLDRSTSRIRVATPEPMERGAVLVRAIVSEGDKPYHQADTLEQELSFLGPVPHDSLVYEFRYQVQSTREARAARWPRSAMPLEVYIPDNIPPGGQDGLWRGVQAWEDVVEAGVPTFIRTSSRDAAQIIFDFPTEPGRGCGTSLGRWSPGGLLLLEKAHISCGDWLFRDFDVSGYQATIELSAHETGHALGLMQHSHRNGEDVMADAGRRFLERGLGDGDIRTLRALYSLPEPDQE